MNPVEEGLFEKTLIKLMRKGLVIKCMKMPEKSIIPSKNNRPLQEPIKINKSVEDVVKSGQLQVRMMRYHSKTYKMICLNEDKILLIMAESMSQPMAIFTEKDTNPILIKDAVDSFENRWRDSVEVPIVFS